MRQLKAEKNDFSHPVLRRALTAALGSSLQQIYCEYCCLGTQGAINVSSAIHDNKNIKILSLRGNSIEKGAAKYFGSLLRILSIHLETLDLSENLLHDGGGKLVAEGLQRNESIKRIYM